MSKFETINNEIQNLIIQEVARNDRIHFNAIKTRLHHALYDLSTFEWEDPKISAIVAAYRDDAWAEQMRRGSEGNAGRREFNIDEMVDALLVIHHFIETKTNSRVPRGLKTERIIDLIR